MVTRTSTESRRPHADFPPIDQCEETTYFFVFESWKFAYVAGADHSSTNVTARRFSAPFRRPHTFRSRFTSCSRSSPCLNHVHLFEHRPRARLPSVDWVNFSFSPEHSRFVVAVARSRPAILGRFDLSQRCGEQARLRSPTWS